MPFNGTFVVCIECVRCKCLPVAMRTSGMPLMMFKVGIAMIFASPVRPNRLPTFNTCEVERLIAARSESDRIFDGDLAPFMDAFCRSFHGVLSLTKCIVLMIYRFQSYSTNTPDPLRK